MTRPASVLQSLRYLRWLLLKNLPKELFCRSLSVSRSSRLLLGLSRSFLGARLREQRMDVAVQGLDLLSQDLVAGLLAEEHKELADGTVD